MSKIVVYKSDNEILIFLAENEKRNIREYFGKDKGRNKEDYERFEGIDMSLEINNNISLRVYQ